MTQTTEQQVGVDVNEIDYSYFEYIKSNIFKSGYEHVNPAAFRNLIAKDLNFKNQVVDAIFSAFQQDYASEIEKIPQEKREKELLRARQNIISEIDSEIAKTSYSGKDIFESLINRKKEIGDTFASETPDYIKLGRARKIIEDNKELFRNTGVLDVDDNLTFGADEDGLTTLNDLLLNNKELSDLLEQTNVSLFVSELAKSHNTNVRKLDDYTKATLFAIYNAKGGEGVTQYLNILGAASKPYESRSAAEQSAMDDFMTSYYGQTRLLDYINTYAKDFKIIAKHKVDDAIYDIPLDYNNFTAPGYVKNQKTKTYDKVDDKEFFTKYAIAYGYSKEQASAMFDDYYKGFDNDDVAELLNNIYEDARDNARGFTLQDVLATVAQPGFAENYKTSPVPIPKFGEGYAFNESDFKARFATDILRKDNLAFAKSTYADGNGNYIFQTPQQRNDRLKTEDRVFRTGTRFMGVELPTQEDWNDNGVSALAQYVAAKFQFVGSLINKTLAALTTDMLPRAAAKVESLFSEKSEDEIVKEYNSWYDRPFGAFTGVPGFPNWVSDTIIESDELSTTSQIVINIGTTAVSMYAGGGIVSSGIKNLAMRYGSLSVAESLQATTSAQRALNVANIGNYANIVNLTKRTLDTARWADGISRTGSILGITGFSAAHSALSGQLDPVGSVYSGAINGMIEGLSGDKSETLETLEDYYRKSNVLTQLAMDVGTDVVVGLFADTILSAMGGLVRKGGVVKNVMENSDWGRIITEAKKTNSDVATDILLHNMTRDVFNKLSPEEIKNVSNTLVKNIEEVFSEDPRKGLMAFMEHFDNRVAKNNAEALKALDASRGERVEQLYKRLLQNISDRIVISHGGPEIAMRIADNILASDAITKQVDIPGYGKTPAPYADAYETIQRVNSRAVIVSDGYAGFKVYEVVGNQVAVDLANKLKGSALATDFDKQLAAFRMTKLGVRGKGYFTPDELLETTREFESAYGLRYIIQEGDKTLRGHVVSITKDGNYVIKTETGQVRIVKPETVSEATKEAQSLAKKKQEYDFLLKKVSELSATTKKTKAQRKELKSAKERLRAIENELIEAGDEVAKHNQLKYLTKELYYKQLNKVKTSKNPEDLETQTLVNAKKILGIGDDELRDALKKTGAFVDEDIELIIKDVNFRVEFPELSATRDFLDEPLTIVDNTILELFWQNKRVVDDTLEDLTEIASRELTPEEFTTLIRSNDVYDNYVKSLYDKVKRAFDELAEEGVEVPELDEDMFYGQFYRALANRQRFITDKINAENEIMIQHLTVADESGVRAIREELQENIWKYVDEDEWIEDVDAASAVYSRRYRNNEYAKMVAEAFKKAKGLEDVAKTKGVFDVVKGAISSIAMKTKTRAIAARSNLYKNLGIDSPQIFGYKITNKTPLIGTNLGKIEDYTPGVKYSKNVVVKVQEGVTSAYYISRKGLKENHLPPSQFIYTDDDGLQFNPDWARLGVNQTIENGNLVGFVKENVAGRDLFRKAEDNEAPIFYLNVQNPRKGGGFSDNTEFLYEGGYDSQIITWQGKKYYALVHPDQAVPIKRVLEEPKTVTINSHKVVPVDPVKVAEKVSKKTKNAGMVVGTMAIGTAVYSGQNETENKFQIKEANSELLAILGIMAGAGLGYKVLGKTGLSSSIKYAKDNFASLAKKIHIGKNTEAILNHAEAKGISVDVLDEDTIKFLQAMYEDDMLQAQKAVNYTKKFSTAAKLFNSKYLKTEMSILDSFTTPTAVNFRNFIFDLQSAPIDMMADMIGTFSILSKSGYTPQEWFNNRTNFIRPKLAKLFPDVKNIDDASLQKMIDLHFWARFNGDDAINVKHMYEERPVMREFSAALDQIEDVRAFIDAGKKMLRGVPPKMIRYYDAIMDDRISKLYAIDPQWGAIMQKFKDSGKDWTTFKKEDLLKSEKAAVSKTDFKTSPIVQDIMQAYNGKKRFLNVKDDYLPQIHNTVIIEKKFQDAFQRIVGENPDIPIEKAEQLATKELVDRLLDVNNAVAKTNRAKYVRDYERFFNNISDMKFTSEKKAKQYIMERLVPGLTEDVAAKVMAKIDDIVYRTDDGYKLRDLTFEDSSGRQVTLGSAYMRKSIEEMIGAARKGVVVKESSFLEHSRTWHIPYDWADTNTMSAITRYVYDAGTRLKELEKGILNARDLESKYLIGMRKELMETYKNAERVDGIIKKMRNSYLHIKDQNYELNYLPPVERAEKLRRRASQSKFIGTLKRLYSYAFMTGISMLDAANAYTLGTLFTSNKATAKASRIYLKTKEYEALKQFAETYQIVAYNVYSFDDVIEDAVDSLTGNKTTKLLNFAERTSKRIHNFFSNAGAVDAYMWFKKRNGDAVKYSGGSVPPVFRALPIINGFVRTNVASTTVMTEQLLARLDELSSLFLELASKPIGERSTKLMSFGNVRKELELLGITNPEEFVPAYQLYRKDLLEMMENGKYDHEYMRQVHPEISEEMARITKSFKDTIHGTNFLVRPSGFNNNIGRMLYQFRTFTVNTTMQLWKRRVVHPIDQFLSKHGEAFDKVGLGNLLLEAGRVNSSNIDIIASRYGLTSVEFASMLDDMPRYQLIYLGKAFQYMLSANLMFAGRDFIYDVINLPFAEDADEWMRMKRKTIINPTAKPKEQITWEDVDMSDTTELFLVVAALVDKMVVIPGYGGVIPDLFMSASFSESPLDMFPLGGAAQEGWAAVKYASKGIKEDPSYFLDAAESLAKVGFEFSPTRISPELHKSLKNEWFRKKRIRQTTIDIY